MDNDERKTTYTPARQRALRKYYEKNRETLMTKILERSKRYYEEKKDTEEWKERKREYNRRYYEKHRMQPQPAQC